MHYGVNLSNMAKPLDVCRLLFENGAKIDIKDDSNMTPYDILQQEIRGLGEKDARHEIAEKIAELIKPKQ